MGGRDNRQQRTMRWPRSVTPDARGSSIPAHLPQEVSDVLLDLVAVQWCNCMRDKHFAPQTNHILDNGLAFRCIQQAEEPSSHMGRLGCAQLCAGVTADPLPTNTPPSRRVRCPSRGLFMHNNDQLLLQLYIICVLLALIGATVVIGHSDWFGSEYGETVE